jgi:histidine decarboxylase
LITTPHHHDNCMIDALIDEVIAERDTDAWGIGAARAHPGTHERPPAVARLACPRFDVI